jgi:hypothetical protein
VDLVRISRHLVVHLMLSWQLLHRLLARPVDAACAPALLPALVASGRAELLLHLLLAMPETARLDVLQRVSGPALGNTSSYRLAQFIITSSEVCARQAGLICASALRSVVAGDHSAFWSDWSSSASFAGAPLPTKRTTAEHAALAESLFDELDDVISAAPEFVNVIRERLASLFLCPPGAEGGDTVAKFWSREVAQRDATISRLSAQLEASQRAQHDALAQLRRADAGAAAMRSQLREAFSSEAGAAEAALERLGDGGGGGGGGDGGGGGGGAAMKMTVSLMRKYREELRESYVDCV